MERAVAHDSVPHQAEREPLAQRNEVARWFFRFYEEAFQEFLDVGAAFQLPDQHDLRDAFEQSGTSPIGKRARWRDVTETAAEELLHWVQASRAKTSVEDRTRFLKQIDQEWMRTSPNILTEVSASASVVFLGQVFANEELRQTIGTHAIGESNYNTSFGVESVEPFLIEIERRSKTNVRQLLTLLTLPLLLEHAQLEDYSEDRAGRSVAQAIQRWGANPERSILQRIVAQQISAEHSPTGSPLDSTPSLYTHNTLYTSELGIDTPPAKIARDAIGRFSPIGFLQEIATGAQNETHATTVDVEDVQAFATRHERIASVQFLQENLHLARPEAQREIDRFVRAQRLLQEVEEVDVSDQIQRWMNLAVTIDGSQRAYAKTVSKQERAQIGQRFETALAQWKAQRFDLWRSRADLETFYARVIEATIKQHQIQTGATRILEHELSSPEGTDPTAHADTLKVLHHPSTRAVLEHRLNFPLVELSLREQLRFGEWLLSTNEARGAATLEVVRRFGPNAARTFLALETDAAHGERILAFANNADPAVAKQVFETFARIADTIDLSAQELANQLYKDDGQTVDAERVRNELVKRGSRILLDTETALTEDPSGVGILDELHRYEADTVLFTSLFSSAFKGKEAPFEALRDLETQTCELADLSPEDRARMKQLLDQEWSKKPLEFLFPETGTFRFFILRRRGRIEGFMRFEDQSNTSRHANFLCVDHSLRGSGVGENVLREAIARAGRNVTLHAEFDAAIPAGSMYIERFGFVGTGIEEEDRDGNLVEWVRIERSDALLKQLPSRTASHEQLRHWARTEAPSPLILTTLEGPVNTMELGMLAALKRAKTQNQKYVLSRYLLEPLANGQERRTLVFDLPTLAASPSATKTQTSGGAKKRSTHPGSPAPHRDHYAE